MYKFYEEINGELSPLSDTTLIAQIKNQLLTGITYAYIKVIGTDLILTEQNYVKDFDISELRFVPDNGVFGQCVAKKLEINLYNEDMGFTLQDKELEVYLKVICNNTNCYVKYGTYIVQKPQNETTTDNTSFTALDYMIKFNQQYVDTITYPCTLRQLASNICAQLGVTLGPENFRNQNFVVENNQFENGESYRNVLQGIAMSAFSWARIDEENVLHFDLNQKEEADEEIDYDGYFKLNKQDLNYGPINRIIIRESEIEGENVSIEDAESIEEYGLTELVISDNPFAYTQEKRTQLISAAQSLLGFTYMPINEISLIGYAYLDCTSKIRFKTLQDTYIDTYLFNHIISYNGVTLDKMEAPALTKTETLYAYKPEISESVKRTEIIVDKQNQIITSVVENVSEQNQKISQITQDIDEIKSEIQDIADVTESEESETGIVSIEKVSESEPVRVVVHPIVTNISLLYPRNNLYPNNNLYMPIRRIRFIRTYEEDEETKTENIDYDLPMDLLYYDSENYDEFILDYGSQTCVINKKVAYNADGTTYVMQNPQTIEVEYPLIELGSGDYTITVLGYSQAYIFVRLMIQNLYTDQFATKIELNSAIRQTTESINLSVDQKLTNYSTTTEMNSAIDVKADEIETSVSKTYETKDNASTQYSQIRQQAGSIELIVGELQETSMAHVDTEYALGDDTITAPTTGWSTTAPTWVQGKYMWQRMKTTYADGNIDYSNPTCIAGAKGDQGLQGIQGPQGEQGIPGINGTNGQTSYFHIKYAPVQNPTSAQMTEIPDKYIGTYVNFNSQDSTNPNDYTWAQFEGSQGIQGPQGQQGIPGTNGQDGQTYYLHIKYSNDGGTTFTGNTGENPGAYIGVLTNTTQQDSTTPSDYTWSQILGDEGVGVSAIVDQYYLSTSNTQRTGGEWQDNQYTWESGKYLWQRTKITWTDGDISYTTPILSNSLNSANQMASNANDKVDNIDLGIRNYAIGTGTAVNIIGENRDNQTGKLYNSSLTKEEINAIESDKLLISFDMEISNAITSGSANIYIGQYNSPYQRVSVLETQPGKYHKEIKLSNRHWTTNVIGYRVNYINTNCTITISNLKMEIGNKYSDWNLAPEDVPTDVSITATEKQQGTQAGILVKLKNKDGTPLAEGEANITMSGLVKFTDLSGIGTTTINGSNITTGTIDASQVNVTNINASNITSGNIQSSNYVADTSGTKIDLSNGAIDTKDFKVSSTGQVTATGGTIGGFTLDSTSLTCSNSDKMGFIMNMSNNNKDFLLVRTGTSGNFQYPFYVRGDGTLHAEKIDITGGTIEFYSNADSYSQAQLKFSNNDPYYGSIKSYMSAHVLELYNETNGNSIGMSPDGFAQGSIIVHDAYSDCGIGQGGMWTTGSVRASSFINTSLAEKKTNFELLKSGLDIIKDIDIYKYNYKKEKNGKKHIGFVIGDKFNYSKEITTEDNQSVDLYSFVSVCCKAIQELANKLDKLEKGE